MTQELFSTVRDNYNYASTNIHKWYNQQNILVKILIFIWIYTIGLWMNIIGFIFGLGIFLDKISLWIQSQRDKIIDSIDHSIYRLSTNKMAYIFSPIKLLLLLPLIIILAFLPKWSSNILEPNSNMNNISHGFFMQLSKSYLFFAKELFVNSIKHGILFFFIAIIIAIYVAPIAFIISALFFILMILDFMGWIIGLIRAIIISSSAFMAKHAGNSFHSVILMPILLTFLAPIYVLLLLIPDLSTNDQ